MNEFNVIQLLLFMMVVLTLLNGIIFFKKLIKLQQETNQLLLKILAKNKNVKKSDAMSSEELEKIKQDRKSVV